MISTNGGPEIGGHRREVDYQKLGPALLQPSARDSHCTMESDSQ
jgi:hypothetical protein